MELKKLKQLTAAVGLAFSVVTAQAGGVPVADIVNLTQKILDQMETIQQWKQQFEHVKQQIQQAEVMREINTGIRGYGAIPDPLEGKWEQVIANPPSYNEMRNRYPPDNSKTPELNDTYKEMAKRDAYTKDFGNLFEERKASIKSLQKKISETDHPAEKQELANRLAIELTLVEAETTLMKLAMDDSESHVKANSAKAQRAWTCKQLGNC